MVSLVKGRKMRREGAPPLLCAQLRDSLSLLKTVRAHKATTPLPTAHICSEGSLGDTFSIKLCPFPLLTTTHSAGWLIYAVLDA